MSRPSRTIFSVERVSPAFLTPRAPVGIRTSSAFEEKRMFVEVEHRRERVDGPEKVRLGCRVSMQEHFAKRTNT